MKIVYSIISIFLSFANLTHAQVTTADRISYIITLQPNISSNLIGKCVENICEISGNKTYIECEIVSKRFRIMAANLSNSAAKKVKAMSCVKGLRPERTDFEANPRVGRSN